MRWLSLAASLALALLTAAVAGAEVRLQQSGQSGWCVRIVPSHGGPWSSGSPGDVRVLNPEGDRLGDGRPTVSDSGALALVAWYRPFDSTLQLALSNEGRWSRWSVETGGVVGPPSVVPTVDGAWLVLWRERDASGAWRTQLIGVEGRDGGQVTEPEVVEEGLVLTALTVGRSIHLIMAGADGISLEDIVLAVSPIRPIDPFEIGRHALGVVEDLSGARPSVTAAAVAELALDARAIEVPGGGRGDGTGCVLVWWSAPRELSFVELAEDGPVLPVETLTAEHGPEHPQRLVQEAVRVVSERH